MARPQAYERELRLATASLAPEKMAQELAAFAKRELAKVQSEGLAPKAYVRSVNGRIGAPEESVILPGPIVYDFSWFSEIVPYALDYAREHSPVGTPPEDPHPGLYKSSWFAMVGGEVTEDYDDIPPDAEVVITNDVPYARKIEIGAMRMRVPPGVVEQTRLAVMRRFGNIISAWKRFISLAGAYQLRRGRGGRRDQSLRYPALIISQRF
jgi:hypothetical protein